MYGIPFPYYDKLEEIYAKDKATRDMSESFAGVINNVDVEITKKSIFIYCDENDDEDSRTQSITHSVQSKKHLIKQEHDTSSSSKKPKLKELKE